LSSEVLICVSPRQQAWWCDPLGLTLSAEAGDAGVADAEVSDTPALPRSGTGSAKL